MRDPNIILEITRAIQLTAKIENKEPQTLYITQEEYFALMLEYGAYSNIKSNDSPTMHGVPIKVFGA